MDDHSFVAASVWKFLDPEPFINDFMAEAKHMVSACWYDETAHVFEMICSSFHSKQVRDLFISRFRDYVNGERARATPGDPFEQQPRIERIIEFREIPRDIIAEAKVIYKDEQRRESVRGVEELVSMEATSDPWTSNLAADVASTVFSIHTLREIASYSGCDVNWHPRVPGCVEIRYPDNRAHALAVEALESVDLLFERLVSDRVAFDLCYDDMLETHSFRFIVPGTILDSDLCGLPNFFREFHETAVARWDHSSLQYRMKARVTQVVTYPSGSFCPWVGPGGFRYGSLSSKEDDWLSPADENVGSLERMLARTRLSDQNRNIMQWRENVADAPGGTERPTLPEDPLNSATGDAIELGDTTARGPLTRAAMSTGVARQQTGTRQQDRPAVPQTTTAGRPSTRASMHTEGGRQQPSARPTDPVPPTWHELFAKRGRRPEAVAAEREEAQAKELGVERWQLPSASRQAPAASTSGPLVDYLEDNSGDQPKFQHETKLKTHSRPPGQSNRSSHSAMSENRLVLEQARDRLHKDARVSVMRILKLSLASHRCTQIHVDLLLGKLFVDSKTLNKPLRCRKNQETGYFPAESWGAVFAVPAGGPRGSPSGTAESIFSKRLCTTWDEVRALLDIWDEQVDTSESMLLFDPRPIKQRSFYVLHCRNNQDGSEALIQVEIDEGAPDTTDPGEASGQDEKMAAKAGKREPTKEIFPPPAALGNVNIHCPGHTWDAALQATGTSTVDFNTLPAFWHIHESLCILPPDANGRPGKVYAKSAFPSVTVTSVELRREKVHVCRVNPDISIALTQVRRHRVVAHGSGDGRVCAWQPPEEQMLAEGRLWWEAHLRSTALTDCLRIRGGMHEEYERLHNQSLGKSSIIKPCLRNLIEVGMWIIPRINPIGNASYLFEKPSHEPTLAMTGTHVAPSTYQATQSLI